ncbi:DUF2750 domain-containing protein [Bowmanella sp. Y26]|uniref:DUF2750 domain-containing protein n=1 Tax=Bowmanella yangjiangensis TaxID=2811230 RepID=UPI001BDC1C85|nr:DUF2750 domain-containing protein [Bowmanella yangjiangensis]MBT1063946.1 DUF2750 domain-containing protein [Bowmanella yangjiangensis]
MSAQANPDSKYDILAQTPEQRHKYLLKRLQETQEIWTLVDDDGAMILTTDEEDCIPIWPDAEFAKDWINGDWSHCQPHKITLSDWQHKWLPGLEEDEIQIVSFPVPGEDGLVSAPWEMAEELA